MVINIGDSKSLVSQAGGLDLRLGPPEAGAQSPSALNNANSEWLVSEIAEWRGEMAKPASTPSRSSCYLMSVLIPGAENAQWYAVVADDVAHARALVAECSVIGNAKIEFERLLTDTTIKRLKLKPGEVKPFV